MVSKLTSKMKNNTNLKAIDFFCGSGGMTFGLERAGIDVLAGIDIDQECQKTYETNNPKSFFVNDDVQTMDIKVLEKTLNIEKNDDNVVFIACSPCQYWSQINTKRDKSHTTKNLLIDFQKFVSFYNPGYIIIENVPGLKSSGESILPDFMKFLKKNKYNFDHRIINAIHYGVPQQRKRFLLIASRVNLDITLPEKSEAEHPIVKDYLGPQNGFPKVSAGHKDETDFQHSVAGLSELNLKRIQQTSLNGGTRSDWKDDPNLQVPAYVGKDNDFRDVYARMSWDKPAPTLTTRFLSFSNGRFGHPEEDRGISIREGATLQTFPKSYKFYGKNRESIARQIGNAVPPELARRIGKAIISQVPKRIKINISAKNRHGKI